MKNAAAAVEEADIALGARLASHRDHPAVKAAAEAGKVGDQEPLYALSASLMVLGLVLWHPRLCRAGLSALAAVGAADLAKRQLKHLVSRTRPHVLLDEGRYEVEPGGSPAKPEQSFPSGHTACTVAAARAVSGIYPSCGPYAAVATVGIAASRVLKGAHWPLDVFAGVVIGLVVEAVTSHLLTPLYHGERRERRR